MLFGVYPLASATTWAAMGAIATLLTALVTLLLGMVYSARQTTYARRSAENARVSADAAIRATNLAERNLHFVAEQLSIIREQTGVLERQVELGLLSLSSQDRPTFDPGPLLFLTADRRYTVELTNVGRGTGWVTRAQLVIGPDAQGLTAGMHAVAETTRFAAPLRTVTQVVSVGNSLELMTDQDMPSPPHPAVLWVIVSVQDFTATEAWTYFVVYRAGSSASFTGPDGRRASAIFAARGALISADRVVSWPLSKVDGQAGNGNQVTNASQGWSDSRKPDAS